MDWLHVHAGVVASGKMLKDNPNTLKAVLRALRKATDSINNDREAAVKIVAREMKTDEALTRDIMALNIYSMEMNEKIHQAAWASSSTSCTRSTASSRSSRPRA